MAEPGATTKPDWITKTPGVCGGEACVRNSRITVRGLVEWRREGLSDEEILQAVQGLAHEALRAARDYYAVHPQEIEESIRLNREA